MQKITPFLWFDGNAEEAVALYLSLFKDAKVISTMRNGEAGAKGSVMGITFQLQGQEFIALNGGPQFTFSPAVSFFIRCEDQAEVDHFWDGLSAGGKKQNCGWLQDKFGLSWQVVPNEMGRMMQDKDPEKKKRMMQAMFKMQKLDVAELKKAFDGVA